MPNEFPKKTGKWLDEDEQVESVKQTFNPRTRELTEEKVVEPKKVKVMYEIKTLESLFCRDFEHEWIIYDSHLYIIKCKNCPLKKHIMPGIEFIDVDGHIRRREDDTIIA